MGSSLNDLSWQRSHAEQNLPARGQTAMNSAEIIPAPSPRSTRINRRIGRSATAIGPRAGLLQHDNPTPASRPPVGAAPSPRSARINRRDRPRSATAIGSRAGLLQHDNPTPASRPPVGAAPSPRFTPTFAPRPALPTHTNTPTNIQIKSHPPLELHLPPR